MTTFENAIQQLISVGLWVKVPGGYQIIDWCGCKIVREKSTQEERKTREYKAWRLAVFKRDRFRCQHCDAKPKKLHAHHIKSWVEYPEIRYKLGNGITLCKNCHHAIHYGEFNAVG